MRLKTRLLTTVFGGLAAAGALLLPGAAWAGGRHCHGHYAYYAERSCHHRYYRETADYRPVYYQPVSYEDGSYGRRCRRYEEVTYYRSRRHRYQEAAYYGPRYHRGYYAAYEGGHCRRRHGVSVALDLGGLYVSYRGR